MNLIDLALRQLQQRQEVTDNPIAREWLDVVRSGDSKRGEEIARNLCENSGVTVQQAMEEARRFFRA